MTCLITGCALVDEANDRCVWGDLHQVGGETFVFNAVLNEKGEAAWQYGDPIPDVTRQILLTPRAECFERRGVLVFDSACFNRAAALFLKESST